jgi:Ca2+-binding RTX toxin-like protein
MLRKVVLLCGGLLVGVIVLGGVALAAVISCPTGPGGECRGTQMADQITGTIGVDQIYALRGDDSVLARGGADFVKGGSGADTMDGRGGNDTMAALQATTSSSVERAMIERPAAMAKTRSTVE